MPNPTKFSLAEGDSGDLSKPVGTMITKVSKVVGDLYVPWQTERVALAETEAAIARAKGKNQINDLQRRALNRFVQEQGTQQANMEAIMRKAIPEVRETADAEALDEDWLAHFFSKCRLIGNGDMQTFWAKVLAGEVNKPATFSKRAVNLLGELDKRDVADFTLLCSFSIYSLASPLIFYKSSQVGVSYNPVLYVKHRLDFGLLNHLDAIGLIHFDTKAEYTKPNVPGGFGPIKYFGQSMTIKAPEQLKVGNAIFTQAGWELAQAVTPQEIPDFFRYLKHLWNAIIVPERA